MNDQGATRKISDIWRFFASMRLGLVLMFFLAGASVLGVLFPHPAPGQSEFFSWIYTTLGLELVFDTWWYRGISILLVLNILVCLSYRIRAIIYVYRFPRTNLGSIDRLRFFETYYSREKLDEVVDRASKALLSSRYHLLPNHEEESCLLYADKHRFALLGPIFSHIGVLILFCGIVWANVYSIHGTFIVGTKEPAFQLTKVNNSTQGGLKDLKLKLDRVKFVASSTGRSEISGALTLMEGTQNVQKSEIGYSSPFSYANHDFYLLYSVPTILLATINNNQQTTKMIRPSENEDSILVPGSDPPMYIYFSDIRPGSASGMSYTVVENQLSSAAQPMHTISLGETVKTIKYPNFSFKLLDYEDALKIRVSDNNGAWLVLLGAIVLLAGMVISLFLRYRKIWISVIAEPDQIQVGIGGYSAKYRVNFSIEFAALVEEIKG